MTYTFSTLSDIDFEDLSRDLIGRELGIRFEAFTSGSDGGIDGRYALSKEEIILQAKHYLNSSASKLKSAIKKEKSKIQKIKCNRYILSTSCRITPKSKDEIAAILGNILKRISDIYLPADLNSLLKKFPDIEKSHIKLWLSSTAILEKIVHASRHTFTAASREEIESKVKIYAPNPSFDNAKDKLDTSHIVIISGPPGVGKTTLAEMLSYAYIGAGWNFIAIRSLEDGFAAIDDTKNQIFFFDDFLGKIALDSKTLASKDSELAKFLRRIRSSTNARFILTTRAYIFEEAKRYSENLADKKLDISKYVLDVEIYTRRIRARILYNHLYACKIPIEYINELLKNKTLTKIIDHKNYNPRIIDYMTDLSHLKFLSPEHYPSAFILALDDPSQIWDTAFRTHIPVHCQRLLLCLFFCSEYGATIAELQKFFESLHPALSKHYGNIHNPKDFEEALKTLEGSFINIDSKTVSFINPSVRDYLNNYLADFKLLIKIVPTLQSAREAQSFWRYTYYHASLMQEQQRDIALKLKNLAKSFPNFPVWKKVEGEIPGYQIDDISYSERISLLIELYNNTKDSAFIDIAVEIADNPKELFSSWLDGETLVKLISTLREDIDYYVGGKTLANTLEQQLIEVLRADVPPDDLDSLFEVIERNHEHLCPEVKDELISAIEIAIEKAEETAQESRSSSSLRDYRMALDSVGSRAGIDENKLHKALDILDSRIDDIDGAIIAAATPDFNALSTQSEDKFDDAELYSLFATLAVEK